MGRRRARNPKGGLDGWMPSIDKTTVQRDMKDELEIEIHRVKDSCVAESIEGSAGSRFRSVDKSDDFADSRLVQNPMRLPEEKGQVPAEKYVRRNSHVVRINPGSRLWFALIDST